MLSSLGDVLEKNGKSQLRIAETEKYNHVTYFFDSERNIDYENEMKRIQDEMKVVVSEEQDSQKMLIEAFGGIGYGIKEV